MQIVKANAGAGEGGVLDAPSGRDARRVPDRGACACVPTAAGTSHGAAGALNPYPPVNIHAFSDWPQMELDQADALADGYGEPGKLVFRCIPLRRA